MRGHKITVRYLAAPGNLTVGKAALLTPLIDAIRHEWEYDHPVADIQEAHWWLARLNGEPVGFGGLIEWPTIKATCGLFLVGVLPAARGHGIQRKLIRARERKARAMGYKRVVTYTWPNNEASRRNLESCGYTLYAPPEKWGAAGSVYYERRLA